MLDIDRNNFNNQQYVECYFKISRIPFTKLWSRTNQYNSEYKDNWWLVNTPLGVIELGCRKRVISIDWSATNIRKIVTNDEVTKSETEVHAWTQDKAIEYLTELGKEYKAV